MSEANVFEMLHEAYIMGRGLTLAPDQVDVLFELLDDQILEANLHYVESAQRRARHRATLAPDQQMTPEQFVTAREIAREHGIDYELYRAALHAADPDWHVPGESWTVGRDSPPHKDMLNILSNMPNHLTTLKKDD